MEICTDPLAPEYVGGAGIGLVCALLTESVLLGVASSLITLVGVIILKHIMEETFSPS
jgi:sorbitol-specific phosphotransferase system component IIBC